MSQRSWLVDPWAFARSAGSRRGELVLRDLSRLDETVRGGGPFLVEVHGSTSADGRLYLDVAIEGSVSMDCQRCLEAVSHEVRLRAVFLLWPLGKDLPNDELAEDGFDALPVGQEADLAELVEDEILLGLPLAPRHEACNLPAAEDVGGGASPFDVLKQLKRPQ